MTQTICVAPPFGYLIGAVVVIYLTTGICLWRYLRARHPSVWEWMGSPIFMQPTTWGLKPSVYTVWFVFSLKPEKLHDSKLNAIAWAFRIEFGLIIALFVAGNALGWLPPSTCTADEVIFKL